MTEDFLRDLETTLNSLSEIFGIQVLLLDGALDSRAVSAAQERVQQKQREIKREKDRIARIRKLDTHRQELEKSRRAREAQTKKIKG